MQLRTLFVALLAVMTASTHAFAFCFAPQLRVSDEYFVSELVVTGTVTAWRDLIDATDPGSTIGTIYSVRVDHRFRSDPGTVIRVYSENTTARFPMRRGRQYLLFLNRDPEDKQRWFVDNCGNSDQLPRASRTLRRVNALPLRQSVVYGEVYSYGPDSACPPMRLTLSSNRSSYHATVMPNCRFEVKVAPGHYRAKLMDHTAKIQINEPGYKDPYCFIVPAGGSAGLSYRRIYDDGSENSQQVMKDDANARSLCAKSAAPQFLF